MIPLLLPAADPLIATAAARLAAERRCDTSSRSDDIVVCGARRADRYRVPLVEQDRGDPRYETVADERQRYLARATPLQEHSPFLVGGGMAGVHAKLVPGQGGPTLRPLAP